MLRTFVLAMALVACGGGGGGDDGGDDGGGSDAAPIQPGPACGATTCMLGQEVCCSGTNTACTATGMCSSQAFACDGPEDCPGMLCCFPNTGGSRCQTLCNEIACHVDNDCPSASLKCCPNALSPNYRVCRTQC